LTIEEIRELFPGTRRLVYFNAAAQSLLPQPVAERVAEVARRQSHRGILSFSEDMHLVERAREAAARLVGCQAGSIAFTGNTADGIACIAEGLDWGEGDEVVLADLEFPANVYPWAAQRRRGVRLRFVPSEEGRIEAERYLAQLTDRTRVLAVSHVQFASGYRIDLEPLSRACRERGILFVVDAIQSLGVCPIDVRALGIGALAVDGRKWLMGPAGCGLLYVAPEWVERISPSAVGTQSVNHPEKIMQYLEWIDDEGQLELRAPGRLREGAGRFEAGFPNLIGIAGLGAALELGERIGRPAIHRRIAQLVERCVDRLGQADFRIHGPQRAEERVGIVAFEVEGSAERLFRRLNREGFSVSVREGRIRIAPHVYNTEDEIDRLVEKVRVLAS
jgi:selenocysteine lyase/cysteine desulfurase